MSRIVRIRLGDTDRATYGCPEWIELDLDVSPNSEGRELRAAGVDWASVTQGQEIVDPATGEALRDDDGNVLRARDWSSIHWVLVWKALRRNGHRFPLADVDFDEKQLTVQWPEAGDGEGKAPDGE